MSHYISYIYVVVPQPVSVKSGEETHNGWKFSHVWISVMVSSSCLDDDDDKLFSIGFFLCVLLFLMLFSPYYFLVPRNHFFRSDIVTLHGKNMVKHESRELKDEHFLVFVVEKWEIHPQGEKTFRFLVKQTFFFTHLSSFFSVFGFTSWLNAHFLKIFLLV